MLKIKVATSGTRGFLKNLFNEPSNKIKFYYNYNDVYEVAGKTKEMLAKIIKFKIFDYIGLFKIVNAIDIKEDACFSYNRFLKTTKPYVIFLENPSALVNYCWDRPKFKMTKLKLKHCFEDENLKAIVCMSKTCYKYINNLYDIPPKIKIIQNYPMIPDDLTFEESMARKKASMTNIECLFISSDFYLKGGRDLLRVFEKLGKTKTNIHLTIITCTLTIATDELELINKMNNVNIVEFNLSKKELDEYYKSSAILINPTRADSFSLVTLEAIKYGCAVIATNVYAIQEMDIDGYNGFLHEPLFKIWDDDGTLNKYYRTHEKTTIRSGIVDEKLTEWMYEKLLYLETHREQLSEFCVNSLKLSRNEEFSSKSIMERWEKIYYEE